MAAPTRPPAWSRSKTACGSVCSWSIEDRGKGIADIPQALVDGYTTAKGMGLGLGGAKRLVDEFAIVSQPGEGTRITLARWRSGSRSADRAAPPAFPAVRRGRPCRT